jgi:hypothetical protein
MKNFYILFLMTILSLNCYAQINFEKGYYISNGNEKINCFIKNKDWKDNPTEIEYKLSTESETKKTTIKSIKEFGIVDKLKYIRTSVKIDRSSNNFNKLSHNKNPIFKDEILFLKVLIEGEYKLYEYIERNLRRYFYNKDNSKVEQLIFKLYEAEYGTEYGENNRFKQQLWTNLKCPTIKINEIENLKYEKRELVKFFMKYNNCNSVKITNYDTKQEKDLFNLTFRPHLNYSTLKHYRFGTTPLNSSNVGIGIGIEAEYILPFKKNKWSISFEPTYQKYKTETKFTDIDFVSENILILKVDYSSIELPISLRHYFFINNSSKIFVNISLLYDLSFNSSIAQYTRNDGSNYTYFKINSSFGKAAGIGFKKNDRYSLEFRYQNRTIPGNSDTVFKYHELSLVLGYSIF